MRLLGSTTSYFICEPSTMQKHLLLSIITFFVASAAVSQPAYVPEIQKEQLNRGLVCLRDGDSLIISWRLLENEESTSFNIYQDDKLLNTKEIKHSTFFKTSMPKNKAAIKVVAIENNKEQKKKSASYTITNRIKSYIPIPLKKPENGTTPDGKVYTYSANDASVGDVDGDGEYEIFLKWEPSNSHDNSHEGYTGNVLIDCYKLTGKHLWRIDLGKNIRAGAHYTQFLVYDFDGDGHAELITKTADGTIDGKGNVIGNPDANWVADGEISLYIQGKRNNKSRHIVGRILDGPEYLTVFEGATGKALKSVDYQPPRGNPSDWGASYGNRCDRFLAAVAYLDGKRPSAIMCRGYYTRSCLAAYNWDGKDLKLRWLFDSQNCPSYSGQGNHNLRVADIDSDGCDEIVYGAMVVNNDGKGLYSTGMGHGDAIHMFPFYPDSTQMQIWSVFENKRDGSALRDARSGRTIFQVKSRNDVGRGMAADIDPTFYGAEMWSASQRGFYDVAGHHHYPNQAIPQNSSVWWDGDLLRELLDRNAIMKWNWNTHSIVTIKNFRVEGCSFNNGSKQNPCLSADIIGDWREEVIVRNNESTELRIYSTTIPTKHRFTTFMLDIPYRIGVAAENVGYNQPPELGFYFGNDMKQQ